MSSLQRSVVVLVVLALLALLHHVLPLLGGGGDDEGWKLQQKQKPLDVDKKAQQIAKEVVKEIPEEELKTFPPPYTGPKNEKQEAIVKAFKHAWAAYKKYAWGYDELEPETGGHKEWFGVGLTLVDSLDTMYIMGLHKEFVEARNWVATKLTFDLDKDVNLFEITIRVIGSLLSAYHLSADKVFLLKAQDLGERLLAAFHPKSKVPYSDVNLKKHTAHSPAWSAYSTTAEIMSIQLEFRDLSRCTGDPRYENVANSLIQHVHKLKKVDGLVPIFIDPRNGEFKRKSTITVGARGDSYYEYLLKQWLQTGKTKDWLKQDYIQAVEGMKKHLMRESVPNKLLFFGELFNGEHFVPKMDHLGCFLAATLTLGSRSGLDPSHLEIAKRLGETCYQMYAQQPTGLAPEITYFNQDVNVKEDLDVRREDMHCLQRPEAVESFFYLYRLTKEEKYRDWGWKIFQAFEKYTKLREGYSAINNVQNPGNVGYRNKMESFFLAETLKYLYLLFSDDHDLVPLDKFILTTEAHLLPIYSS